MHTAFTFLNQEITKIYSNIIQYFVLDNVLVKLCVCVCVCVYFTQIIMLWCDILHNMKI